MTNTGEIRHILASMLGSYLHYLEALDYHANINARSIVAIFNEEREKEKKEQQDKMEKQGYKVKDDVNYGRSPTKLNDLLDYDFKFIFSHLDFISKEDWMAQKISNLYLHKK